MKPEYIILHTAGVDKDVSADEIRFYHTSLGWRDIGYHYVVRQTGEIEGGRPDDERGAHCTSMGMNRKSIGIERVLGHRETGARKTCPGKLIHMHNVRDMLTDVGVVVTLPTPALDAVPMFRSLCDIFDDPDYTQLPEPTQRKVKELRNADPFDLLTRDDLV